jgi:cytochrome c oxidase assembly factor CtaG
MVLEIYSIMAIIILAFFIGWNKGSYTLKNNNSSYPSYSLVEFLMGKSNDK